MASSTRVTKDRIETLEAENAELRKQRDLFQAIFDYLPLMVNVISPDDRFEIVNRCWEETQGWTREEVASRDFWSVLASQFIDSGDLGRARSFTREGKGEWTDFAYFTRDGRKIETTWTNVHLPDGRWFGIGQDVTERKQAEEALRASEERFRAMYTYGPLGIVLSDLTGRLTFANPVFCRLLGYEESELIGRHYSDLTFERDYAAHSAVVQQLFEGERDHCEAEKRYRRKDGTAIWGLISLALARDAQGRPAFALGMVQDITERKRSEEKLRRTQTYLADAETLSHVGSWAMNTIASEITFWSDEHFRIFGFDPADGIPALSTVIQRFHPEDLSKLNTFADAVARRCDFQVEFRLMLPDGSVRHVLGIGHPVLNEAGEVCEFAGISVDVTERRRAELELQQYAEQLRALAAQVERAREGERTRIARELHDELGSSLTSLKWDLQEMEAELAGAGGTPPAVGSRIARMAGLADASIKAVKRISSELRPSLLDDLGLFEALDWHAKEFEKRTGIATVCDFASEPELTGERATAVFRIAQEALTNVLRHANASRVWISTEDCDGDFVLRIADDGRGITSEEMSGREALGILGMRERARLAGGGMDIEGVAGEGTTVSLHIPIGGPGGELA